MGSSIERFIAEMSAKLDAKLASTTDRPDLPASAPADTLPAQAKPAAPIVIRGEAPERPKPVDPPAPAEPRSLAEQARLDVEMVLAGRTLDGKIQQAYAESLRTGEGVAARVARLRAKTGLPTQLIAPNIELLEFETSKADFDAATFRKNSPLLAGWLAKDPNNVGAIGADLSDMGMIERQFRASAHAIRHGRATTRLAPLGEQAMFRDLTDQEEARVVELEKQLEQENIYEFNGYFAQIPAAAAEQLPIWVRTAKAAGIGGGTGLVVGGTIGAAVGALLTPITGPAAIGVGAKGLGSFGLKAGAGIALVVDAARFEASLAYLDYRKVKDAGGDPLDRELAVGAAAVSGVVNGLLEMLPADALLKTAPGLRTLSRAGLRRLLRQSTRSDALRAFLFGVGETMLKEGATEFMQEMSTGVARELALMEQDGSGIEMTTIEYLERLFGGKNLDAAVESFVVGTQAGGGMAATTAGASLAIDLARGNQATRHARNLERAREALDRVKLDQEAPTLVRDAVAAMAEAGPDAKGWFDPKEWREFWQAQADGATGQPVDARAVVQEIMGSTDAYDAAVETGATFGIPMADVLSKLAANEAVRPWVIANVRAAPGEMSAAEALNSREHTDAVMGELLETVRKEIIRGAPIAQTAKRVETIVKQKAKAAGIGTQERNAVAALFAGLFKSASARGDRADLVLQAVQNMQIGSDAEIEARRTIATALEAEDAATPDDVVDYMTARDAGRGADAVPLAERPEPDPESAERVVRTPSGRLRTNLERVASDAIADEISRLYDLIGSDAPGMVAIETLDGAWTGTKDVFAAGRVKQRKRAVARLEAELVARGVDPSSAVANRNNGLTWDGKEDESVGDTSFDPSEFTDDLWQRAAQVGPGRATPLSQAEVELAEAVQRARTLLEKVNGFLDREVARRDAAGLDPLAQARAQGKPGEQQERRAEGPTDPNVQRSPEFQAARARAEMVSQLNMLRTLLEETPGDEALWTRLHEVTKLIDDHDSGVRPLPPLIRTGRRAGEQTLEQRRAVRGMSREASRRVALVKLELSLEREALRPTEWDARSRLDRLAVLGAWRQLDDRGQVAPLMNDPAAHARVMTMVRLEQLRLAGQAVAANELPATIPGHHGFNARRGVWESEASARPAREQLGIRFGNPGDVPILDPTHDEEARKPAEADVEGFTAYQRTDLVTALERELPTTKITRPEHAAQAFAYLATGPTERLDVLVTDAKGKVLAIVGGFQGGINMALAPTNVIMQEIFRVPGAARVWIGHNHPSGSTQLSPDDRVVAQQIAMALRESGVEMRGIFAVALQEHGMIEWSHEDYRMVPTYGSMRAYTGKTRKVPHLSRVLTKRTRPEGGVNVHTQTAVMAFAEKHLGDREGLIVTDGQWNVVGFIDVPESAAKRLEGSGEIARIYRALSVVNGSNVLVWGPTWSAKSANNIGRMLAMSDHDVPDVFYRGTHGVVSAEQHGTLELRGRTFEQRPAKERTLFQKAFHGSPHVFARFSMQHVGTGEGAQAWGHGLYFAEHPAVAENYRSALTKEWAAVVNWRMGGFMIYANGEQQDYSPRDNGVKENIRASLVEDMLLEFNEVMGRLAGGESIQRITLEYLDEAIERYRGDWPEAVATAEAYRKELAKRGAVGIMQGVTPGATYAVDLDEAAFAGFMDHDAPLAKQPEALQDLVRDELKAQGYLRANENGPIQLKRAWSAFRIERMGMNAADTGYYAYFALRDALEKRGVKDATAATSALLASKGIKGASYRDEQSRGRRGGTRNFVVFDESIITVTHVNGKLATQQERDQVLYQMGAKPIFYSALYRAIAGAKQAAMPAHQWLQWVEANGSKLAVKKMELEWSGIREYLAAVGKRRISREDLAAFVAQHGVQVEDVVLDAGFTGEDLTFEIDRITEEEVTNQMRERADEVRDLEIIQLEDAEGDPMFQLVHRVNEDDHDVLQHFMDPEEASAALERAQQAELEDLERDIRRGLDMDEIRDEARQLLEGDRDGDVAKHADPDYRMAGGEDYGELLLTVPGPREIPVPAGRPVKVVRGDDPALVDLVDAGGIVLDMRNIDINQSDEAVLAEAQHHYDTLTQAGGTWWGRLAVDGPMYERGHYETVRPNVVGFVRYTTRRDAEGRRVLFLEEIQSDWAQKGREVGFASAEDTLRRTETHQRMLAAEARSREATVEWNRVGVEWLQGELEPKGVFFGRTAFESYLTTKRSTHDNGWLQLQTIMDSDVARTFQAALDKVGIQVPERVIAAFFDKQDARAAHTEASKAWADANGRPPVGPFVGDTAAWTALMMKRMARYAAEGGFEAIAWAPGAVHGERWSQLLRAAVREIRWIKKGGRVLIQAVRRADGEVLNRDVAPDEISELAGQEVAQQVNGSADTEGVITGDDLTVGGVGFAAYYDQIVPQVVSSTFKKFKVKVAPIPMDKDWPLESHKMEWVGDEPTIEMVRAVAPAARNQSYLHNRFVEDVIKIMAHRGMGFGQALIFTATDRAYRIAADDYITFLAGLVGDGTGHLAKVAQETAPMGFTLTPELRAAALEGQSMFQPGKQPENMEDPQGRIRIATDFALTQRSQIERFANADKSTFLHESAHLFLALYKVMVADEGASETLKRDFAGLYEWLGAEPDMPLTDQQEELFARGFEAYLREGRAPSLELRSVFQRFSKWLVEIYKTLQDLWAAAGQKVELTDEVRGILDRMVATDEEIERAERAQARQPLTFDGLTEEQQQAYREAVAATTAAANEILNKELLEEVAQEDQAWYQKKRLEVEREVRAEVHADPAYRALAALQRGQMVDGSPLPPNDPLRRKLDRAELVRIIGEERVKALPRSPGVVFTRTGGVDPDLVAGAFGFDGGLAMLEGLEGAKERMEDRITRLTDERTRERHGEPTREMELPQKAMDAIHNAEAERKARLEAELLGRAAMNEKGRADIVRPLRLASQKELGERARLIVGNSPVRGLSPAPFQRAEMKAAKEAARHAEAGRWAEAFHAKQREIMALALYREVKRFQREQAKAKKLLQGIFRPVKKIAKSRDTHYVLAARAYLARFGIGSKTPETPEQILAPVKAYDEDAHENLTALIQTTIPPRDDARDLTVDEFRAVMETAKTLWTMARRDREVEIDGRRLSLESVVDGFVSDLSERKAHFADIGKAGQVTVGQKAAMGLSGLLASARRVESWVDMMDGGDPRGQWRAIFFTPISEAADRYRKRYIEGMFQLQRIAADNVRINNRTPISAPELQGITRDGKPISYTWKDKAHLLGAMLHTGNASNFDKMLRGMGWERAGWDKMIARLQDQGVLTKGDYDTLQGVWNLFESIKPEAQKVHYAQFGYYFDEITAEAFSTPFGDYAGGYVPATPDPTVVEDAAVREEQRAADRGAEATLFPVSVFRGFTKSRTQEYARPLVMDMRLVSMHWDAVTKFVYLSQPVRDVGRVLRDPRLRQALGEVDHGAAANLLAPFLDRAAKQAITSPGGKGNGWKYFDRGARYLRKMSGMQFMVGNVVNTLQNVTGFTLATLKVKRPYLQKALWRYLRDPSGTAERINELSPMMATRTTASIIEAAKVVDSLMLDPTKYERAKDFADRHAYFLQTATQSVLDVVVWGGAFDQAKAGGATDVEAVREADAAVRQTQGSFNPEDMSRMETGTPFMRLFTMFWSWFNMQANLLGTEFAKTLHDAGLKKGAPRLAFIFTMGFLAPAIISELLYSLARGGEDDEDGDGYLDDYLTVLLWGTVRSATALVPIGGQLTQLGLNQLDDRWYNDRISASPVFTVLEGTARALTVVPWRAIHPEHELRRRDVQDMLTLLSLTTGLPFAGLNRPVGYLIDVQQGDAEPSGAADFTRGVLSGRP